MIVELKEVILHFLSVFPIILIIIKKYKQKIYNINLIYGEKTDRNGIYKSHFYFCIIYIFLITGMITVAGIPSLIDFGIRKEYFNFNFIPFYNNTIKSNFLNIIMFIPFGFILPIMWDKFKSFKMIFKVSFLFSLFIEVLQIFNYRATDVNDLIMNTLGGIIGFFIYKIIIYIYSRYFFTEYKNNKSNRYILKLPVKYNSIFISNSEFIDLTSISIILYVLFGAFIRNYIIYILIKI